MPARSGLDAMRQALAEQAQRAASGRRWLTLRENGESALIRFLSDIEDDEKSPGGRAVTARFHQEKTTTQSGATRFGDPVMCSEDEECSICAQGEPSRLMALFWVYVYHIDHAEQNPRVGKYNDAEPWKPVKTATMQMFREEVGEVRILKATSRTATQIMTTFGHEGSLLTKDYVFTRVGARGDTNTTYNFYPEGDAKKLGVKLDDLTPMIDLAEGRVPFTTEEAPSRGKRTERREVPESDLADLGEEGTEEEGDEGEGDDFGFED